MRPTLKRYLSIIVILLLLSSCNLRQLYAPTPQPTLTQPADTQLTATPNPIILPTETPGPTPTSTLLPFVKVDGLRVAYIIDGNLYVQDSGGQPLQLTESGIDRNPIFSDDGQKIVFFRGEVGQKNAVYSINPDGSQERALVTSDLLRALGVGYDEESVPWDLAFVPGKHQMLFSTQEFKLKTSEEFFNNKINQDLLIVDIDNAQIKQLVAPKQGEFLLFPNKAFQVSPNGKLVAVQTKDHIDVLGINGEKIHESVVTYLPNWINEWILMYWSQDSSQLMILPPTKGNTDPVDGPDLRTIRQYPIDGNIMTEIHLSPAPMADYFALSPSRSWIVYNYYYYAGITDKTILDGVYIGDLSKGSSRRMELKSMHSRFFYFDWSLDDKHFILHFDDLAEMYLGNTNGDISPLTPGIFIGWVDRTHYIFYDKNAVIMSMIDGEESFLVANLPKSLQNFSAERFAFFYTK